MQKLVVYSAVLFYSPFNEIRLRKLRRRRELMQQLSLALSLSLRLRRAPHGERVTQAAYFIISIFMWLRTRNETQ